MSILVTGSSGFIGFHTAKKLLKNGEKVVGFDNENSYYSVRLKQDRRKQLEKFSNFSFYKGSLENKKDLKRVFHKEKINIVCHLAAQAGVRYSLENPDAYIQSNVVGFHNIINLSKDYNIKNFVYASSSSVYGNNQKSPFSVNDSVDHPISLYAATKKSNELIAHTYSHLYDLPTTGLRFFTVYGPWGRPDMALFLFTDKIANKKPIEVYNHGDMKRDFTYIDDIVDGIIKCINNPHQYEVFNLGNDQPNNLEDFICIIEKHLNIKAEKKYKPMQPGDVKETWANIDYTKEKINRKPKIKLDTGIKKFIEWYNLFYK